MTTASTEQPQLSDWHVFLHEQLRSDALRTLPPGAETVLSGGAAGSWYFDWFNACYPTQVRRHIAVEAFAPRPADLPPEVEWLERTLGNLGPVADGEVDLVYGGEVIEHLWPDDVIGFLLEAHRVLRPNGTIVLDSPNRRITLASEWLHPEHTVEFTPDEIAAALRDAGFSDIRLRGIWLTYDAEHHRLLPIEVIEEEGEWPWQRRVEAGATRPEDSFIWWAEATKLAGSPNEEQLREIVWRSFTSYRAARFARFQHQVGELVRDNDESVVQVGRGERGFLVAGPYVPMSPGTWVARFRVGIDGTDVDPAAAVARFDVTVGIDPEPVADRVAAAAEIPSDGTLGEIDLVFRLDKTEPGTQFRVESLGAAALSARLRVDVEQALPRPRPHPTPHVDARAELPPQVAAEPQTEPEPAPPPPPRRSLLRRLARVPLWPLIRFFDPRFQGLAAQADVYGVGLGQQINDLHRLVEHLRAEQRALHREAHAQAIARLDALLRADMETTAEATGALGVALAEAREQLDDLRTVALPFFAIHGARARPFLPPQVPWTEEYVQRHRQFVAETLDNEDLVELFSRGEELPRGFGVGLEERVVEYPWTYAQRLRGRALDAGSSLNFEHILDRFQPRFDRLDLVTLAPEFESFPERGVSYVYADLRELPFKNACFDTIVCISTLDHIGMDNSDYGIDAPLSRDPQAEARRVLAELRRVIAPSGTFLFTVPYGQRQNLGWSRQFDREELMDLINAADARESEITVYQYDTQGWQLSDLEAAADAVYHDYKQNPGPTPDLAAAARAVACVRLEF